MSAGYVVVEARSPEDLATAVKVKLKEGYAPLGGVAVLRAEPKLAEYQPTFYQALYRPANYILRHEP